MANTTQPSIDRALLESVFLQLKGQELSSEELKGIITSVRGYTQFSTEEEFISLKILNGLETTRAERSRLQSTLINIVSRWVVGNEPEEEHVEQLYETPQEVASKTANKQEIEFRKYEAEAKKNRREFIEKAVNEFARTYHLTSEQTEQVKQQLVTGVDTSTKNTVDLDVLSILSLGRQEVQKVLGRTDFAKKELEFLHPPISQPQEQQTSPQPVGTIFNRSSGGRDTTDKQPDQRRRVSYGVLDEIKITLDSANHTRAFEDSLNLARGEGAILTEIREQSQKIEKNIPPDVNPELLYIVTKHAVETEGFSFNNVSETKDKLISVSKGVEAHLTKAPLAGEVDPKDVLVALAEIKYPLAPQRAAAHIEESLKGRSQEEKTLILQTELRNELATTDITTYLVGNVVGSEIFKQFQSYAAKTPPQNGINSVMGDFVGTVTSAAMPNPSTPVTENANPLLPSNTIEQTFFSFAIEQKTTTPKIGGAAVSPQTAPKPQNPLQKGLELILVSDPLITKNPEEALKQLYKNVPALHNLSQEDQHFFTTLSNYYINKVKNAPANAAFTVVREKIISYYLGGISSFPSYPSLLTKRLGLDLVNSAWKRVFYPGKTLSGMMYMPGGIPGKGISSAVSSFLSKRLAGTFLGKAATALGTALGLGTGPAGWALTLGMFAKNQLEKVFAYLGLPRFNVRKNLAWIVVIFFCFMLFAFQLLDLKAFQDVNEFAAIGDEFEGSSYVAGIDCVKNPTDPVCSICTSSDGKTDPSKCAWPVSRGCITQGPWAQHAVEKGNGGQGIDIGSGADGLPVRATYPGEVIEARWGYNDNQGSPTPDYGNMVRIKTSTSPSFVVIYAHLRKTNSVNVGDLVQPNTIIGFVDSTGWGEGHHLHMEIQGVPASNVLPIPIPACSSKPNCAQQIKALGYEPCWTQ